MQKLTSARLLSSLVFSLAMGSVNAHQLMVSAAASLTNAFKELAPLFEAKHPDSKVLLNFAASDALVQQVAKGAPVDVLCWPAPTKSRWTRLKRKNC